MTETLAYDITGKIGEIEFHKYPDIVLATVRDFKDDSGFNLLFKYITGNNQARGKISMTAPVITSEQITMTAPVVTDEQSMSFVMPAGKTRGDLPDPLDNRIQITTLPSREIAVIRFRGYAKKIDVDDIKLRLLNGLNKAGVITRGLFFLMRYNPPWTPGFLRRNEVGIEIVR
jgi:hypothetical protein